MNACSEEVLIGRDHFFAFFFAGFCSRRGLTLSSFQVHFNFSCLTEGLLLFPINTAEMAQNL